MPSSSQLKRVCTQVSMREFVSKHKTFVPKTDTNQRRSGNRDITLHNPQINFCYLSRTGKMSGNLPLEDGIKWH